MKTICIKTNNTKAINYLLEDIKKIELDNVYLSCHKFKIYNNIFIHYTGVDEEIFLENISQIISSLVLHIYENNILGKILQYEYFYFDSIERRQILDKVHDIIGEDANISNKLEKILFNAFYNFFISNTKLYLNGFITFRVKKYIEELEKIIDDAVSQYVIEKEYIEFISLLKMYVNSEKSQIDFVHLIYNNDESILLDKHKNIIPTDINLFNAKYLSDISFSSSDIILNTLLNLIPQKIYIHLINHEEDDFITTLKLIFENRVSICRECGICNIYKKNFAT